MRRGSTERRPREDRAEASEKPMLVGWKLEILPEVAAVEAIAKQVRSRAKAYPLFELARLIIRLSERYTVRLQPESETPTPLLRVKRDGSLWTSRKEALDHLLSKHTADFYRADVIQTEPPKGAYTVVAECGMSGTLLGPPNHHSYQSRLAVLYSSRFKNLPFEVYKSRIRMNRDEALMERWKAEQSTKTVYYPLAQGQSSFPETNAETFAKASASPDPLPAEEVPEATPFTEAEPSPEAGPDPGVQTVHAEAAASATPDDQAEKDPEGAAETAVAETSGELPAEGALSWEELASHFLEHHADLEIEVFDGTAAVPGQTALHGSTPLLRELLLKHLRELDRFPLPVAHLVSKELSAQGMQLFKAHIRRIVHVSMARPKYLNPQETPVAENFRAILEYLEAHPKQSRDKQWSGLLALRTETGATEEETRQRREQALGSDLLWLLHQGHVIDFAMGNLQAAHPPKPQPQGKKEEKRVEESPVPTTEGSVPETDSPAPATPPLSPLPE